MQEIVIMTLMAHAKCGWSMIVRTFIFVYGPRPRFNEKKFCELYFKNEKEVYIMDSQLSWRERLSK